MFETRREGFRREGQGLSGRGLSKSALLKSRTSAGNAHKGWLETNPPYVAWRMMQDACPSDRWRARLWRAEMKPQTSLSRGMDGGFETGKQRERLVLKGISGTAHYNSLNHNCFSHPFTSLRKLFPEPSHHQQSILHHG